MVIISSQAITLQIRSMNEDYMVLRIILLVFIESDIQIKYYPLPNLPHSGCSCLFSRKKVLFGLNSCQDCCTVPSRPIQVRKIDGPLSCIQVPVLITEAERLALLNLREIGINLRFYLSMSLLQFQSEKNVLFYMDSVFLFSFTLVPFSTCFESLKIQKKKKTKRKYTIVKININ